MIFADPIEDPFSSLTVPEDAIPTYAESLLVKTILYFHGNFTPSAAEGVTLIIPLPLIHPEFSKLYSGVST